MLTRMLQLLATSLLFTASASSPLFHQVLTAKPLAPKPKCGNTPIAPEIDSLDRIVGGIVAKPYSWPWQVAFYDFSYGGPSFHAAGSLISDRWILTAAHVAASVSNKSALVAKIGVFEHARNNERGEAVGNVDKIVVHPQYLKTNNPHNYDIALVRLATAVRFTDHIQPVCLPAKDNTVLKSSATAFVTGWGLLKEFGSGSPVLRQVDVKTVSDTECLQNYATKGGFFNAELMVCAASPGKDSCQNDSGGPMVIKHADGAWYEHGIVSFGSGCARPDAPGVYARTTAFCDFIEETTGTDLC